MEKRQIVNIVNFVRGFDPRTEDDLTLPVREQIALMRRHGLKGTFLLQYDALCNPAFADLVRTLEPNQFELGVWLEMVEPLAERAGIPWKGRYAWDWQARYGFSVGYTPEEREALIDALFEGFKEQFGFYPRTLGSWAFDAHTLDYAAGRFGLDAACNCKEQWGTDGYTIWGGYYGQGYYPSKRNALCPAQTAERQIGVPVFRMLGADPVYQYDCGLDYSVQREDGAQGVVSLEPVYSGDGGGGGNPDWVEWYLQENFNGDCVTFGYTQAGQENSFGWPAMEKGLRDQFARFEALQAAGKLTVETMGETGRWYKESFSETPPAAITAHDDWKRTGRKSVWYCSKNYRINLYAEDGCFWIRDLYLFRDDYPERYLDKTCNSDQLTYDNLPVADGNRFSGNGVRGGLYPVLPGFPDGLPFAAMTYAEAANSATVSFTGGPADVVFHLSEDGVRVETPKDAELSFELRYAPGAAGQPDINHTSDKDLDFAYEGYAYRIQLEQGRAADERTLHPEEGLLSFNLAANRKGGK